MRPDADTPVNPPRPTPAARTSSCPDCGVRVAPDQLDAHLRREHRVFRFRGVRRTLSETIATLLNLLSDPNNVGEAWPLLETIAREEYGGRADAVLASSAVQALARVGADDRAVTAAGLAVASGTLALRLVPLLASEPEDVARHLALRIAGRLPSLADPGTRTAVMSLLPDKRLPLDAALAAASVLLQSTGKEGPSAARVFQALIAGWGKSRGLDRLGSLEKRIGTSATLAALQGQLQERQRLSCPRCNVEMRRPEMIEHLWQEHRLVLDGRRVREPWAAIEHWLDDALETPDQAAEIVERCRALAEKTDAAEGTARLSRMLLAHGLGDDESRQALLAEAAQRRASLCPHCYARVPVPLLTPSRSLNVWRGRVSGFGYRVEVADGGLFTRLEIETPDGSKRRTFEPPRRLTRKGATLFFTGPFVLLAFAVGTGLLLPELPPLVPVTLLLAAALAMKVFVNLTWRKKRPVQERAVDIVWQVIAPHLHEKGFSLNDSGFAAALAWTSLSHGRPAARREPLQRLLTLTEKAVAAGSGAVEHLADLRRLAIDAAARAGEDPVPMVVGHLARCFEGKLSLSYAERLLAGWRSEWWTKKTLARLRILLCDRAFEAGFEVSNLLDAAVAAPTLGAVLETEDRDGLARLRLLWSLRSRRPWDRCGPSVTVFDVAEDAESSSYLSRYPDLLLLQEPEGWRPPGSDGDVLPVVVCGRGVVFQETLFDRMPQMLEVVELGGVVRGGYNVRIDESNFWMRHDPQKVTDRLERWFQFSFREFAPKVAEVHGWRSPSVTATLKALESVPCPECGRPVLPREGQVGAAIKESAR